VAALVVLPAGDERGLAGDLGCCGALDGPGLHVFARFRTPDREVRMGGFPHRNGERFLTIMAFAAHFLFPRWPAVLVAGREPSSRLSGRRQPLPFEPRQGRGECQGCLSRSRLKSSTAKRGCAWTLTVKAIRSYRCSTC
jgi:hypothetical protein